VDPDQALRGYYLDPDRALAVLEKQSASARIGVWAARQGVNGVGVTLAEELQALGVSEQKAQQGFGQVASQTSLNYGRGDVTNQDTLIGANLRDDATDAEAVRRVASSRVGRFQGGGEFTTSRKGVVGVGSSST
jgi:hypothetical protein